MAIVNYDAKLTLKTTAPLDTSLTNFIHNSPIYHLHLRFRETSKSHIIMNLNSIKRLYQSITNKSLTYLTLEFSPNINPNETINNEYAEMVEKAMVPALKSLSCLKYLWIWHLH